MPQDIQGWVDALRDGLEPELNEAIDRYVFSGDVTDLSLQTQGFTELVRKHPPPFDFEVLWACSSVNP